MAIAQVLAQPWPAPHYLGCLLFDSGRGGLSQVPAVRNLVPACLIEGGFPSDVVGRRRPLRLERRAGYASNARIGGSVVSSMRGLGFLFVGG